MYGAYACGYLMRGVWCSCDCREEHNLSKNRYKDVICYDDNRVILEGSEVGGAWMVCGNQSHWTFIYV